MGLAVLKAHNNPVFKNVSSKMQNYEIYHRFHTAVYGMVLNVLERTGHWHKWEMF